MQTLRKKNLFWRLLVYGVCCAFVSLVYPHGVVGKGSGLEGSRTSEEAALVEFDGPANRPSAPFIPFTFSGWRPTPAFLSSSALSDTTELEFPEDEKEKHLVRDVGIFIVVSAFVAYFVIKVFLEGEKNEATPPDDGKDIP